MSKSVLLQIEKQHTISYEEVYCAFYTYLQQMIVLRPDIKELVTTCSVDVAGNRLRLDEAIEYAIKTPRVSPRDTELLSNVAEEFLKSVWPLVVELVEENVVNKED